MRTAVEPYTGVRGQCSLGVQLMNILKSAVVVLGFTSLLTLVLAAPLQASQAGIAQPLQTQNPTPAAAPRLRGTIKDQSGGLMVGVDVAVIQGTSVVKAMKTDADGGFSYNLPAGAYTIAITSPD